MPGIDRMYRFTVLLALFAFCLAGAGCKHLHCFGHHKPMPDWPRELEETDQAPHLIDPPDILHIDAIRLVPLPPYKIEPLDVLLVQFPSEPGALAKEVLDDLIKTGRTLSGNYSVDPEGTINLGTQFGKVKVVDMTIEQAQAAVTQRLYQHIRKEIVDSAKVFVDLAQFSGLQQIRGDHLVRPDGTISLGMYGFVKVSGMTQEEAKFAVEAHLSQYLLRPKISLDVSGYNSKVYYVIFDGGGFGEQVYRMPVTGKETVLDAIGEMRGLPVVSCRKRIWIARPMPDGHQTILPVHWNAIARRGLVDTNYQLFPGDRIYVQAEPLITLDTCLSRIFSPIERTFGIVLLGNGTVRAFQNGTGGVGGFGGGFVP